MDSQRIGCALLIIALNENKTKKKWMKNRLKSRGRNSHVNILKEIHAAESLDFINYFGMSLQNYSVLLTLVTPLIEKKNTRLRESISANERLTVTLRFLATGRNFRDLSYSCTMGRTTVGEVVMETCQAITQVLKEYIKMPNNVEGWKHIAEDFGQKWNFFNCIGAIDGKHVAITKPAHSGSLYYNYKKFFSIVLMAAVNANYEFLMVDVGSNGRTSDTGGMFYTKFWQQFIHNKLNLPPAERLPGSQFNFPYVFVADDNFPLSQNLMKPYGHISLGIEQKIFNYRLSRAKSVVENAFGILSARFEVLQHPMRLEPEKASIITVTCCYLHNFLIKYNKKKYAPRSVLAIEDFQTGNVVLGSEVQNRLIGLKVRPNSGSYEEASEMRNLFCAYFNNEGSVPWQWKFI